jgi:peptide/nickel transport system ATP-binding protein
MRRGEMVETGGVDAIFATPGHDYTKMLLSATPRFDSGIGAAAAAKRAAAPATDVSEPLLKVDDLRVVFPVAGGGGLFARRVPLRAVDGVSFELRAGETVGVVGESGCGKSTLARAILRLVDPSSGAVAWLGRDISKGARGAFRPLRKDMQIVFQDPLASLDPRMTVGASIAEPLTVFRPDLGGAAREAEVRAIMERMELDPALINRYPHELSGGQNQRVGLGRAMILRPKLVIADEAVSALDVSVQAQILDLLARLQAELGMAMMFISHDLSVVRQISHRVLVLYLGRVVEAGASEEVFADPRHPYTRALLSAAPIPDPQVERSRHRIRLQGDLPSPLDPRAALRFLKSRLDAGDESYRPQLIEIGPGRLVAEHDPTPGAAGPRAG